MANRLVEALRNARILNGIRVRGNPQKSGDIGVEVDNDIATTLLEDSDVEQQILSTINKFRELSSNRNEQYDAFDEMEKDSIISAAIRMYADDATQYNLDGNVIWAESDEPNISDFANRLIDVLKLNENAWFHIYNLVKYGDLYLETFYDDEIPGSRTNNGNHLSYGTSVMQHAVGARMEEYVEMVNNPATIFDLRKMGKTQGFIVMEDIDDNRSNAGQAYNIQLAGTTQQILPADKYIHIMIGSYGSRRPESISVVTGEGENTRTDTYTVSKGKSLLEDVFKTFREISLMEDSILLNRVTRSAVTRIIQVEVGDMPKEQVREKLRKIKMMIEQKNFMDKNAGTFSSQAAPGPVDNVIYVPTRNGNGAITSSSIGGDADPKTLIDLEYYQQKEAGGLGIPLSYLKAQSGDGGGLSSGTALTKLDNRYARTIKRIQTAYISGIQTLINLFAIRKGLNDYVNNFKIRMLSPSTIEDSDRDDQLDNRVRMLDAMLSMIDKDDMYSNEAIKDVTEYMISTFLNKPEVTKILKDDSQKPSSEEQNEDFEDSVEDSSYRGDASSYSRPEPIESADFSDIESTGFEMPEDAENSEASEPSTTTPEGFGDFEDFA